ncbi:integrator complex subunit 14 isoform X7 [Eubalaena glacialis]|uniref:integrator complex subunit 14 isoform X7 n=1 Tax=Eubalaena glacialis TaxID=27606 RepID=UPI002A5A7650|nr:integrator complex subunit 14 isoform X7 [Eubalaena glacialis]
MPTVVVMDVSLSMTRPVSIEGSEEYQRKHLAAHGLTMLFEHMATNYKLEFTALVVFSSLWELMVPFTRDYNTLQEALSNMDDYDKTCLESALVGVCNIVQQEWGGAIPCQVVLVTDGCLGIGRGSLRHSLATHSQRSESNRFPLPFPFPSKLYIMCMANLEELQSTDSLDCLERLIDLNNGEGQIFTIDGPLCLKNVQSMFGKLIDLAYTPFHAVLKCGHLTADVQVFPRPEPFVVDEEIDPIPKVINTDAKENPYGEDDNKSPFPLQPKNKRSYAQNVTVWIKPSGLQTDVQKILRNARKLPEKTQTFYKELNRLRKAALAFGFLDLLKGVADMLERECTLLPDTAHPDAAFQLTHAAQQLKLASTGTSEYTGSLALGRSHVMSIHVEYYGRKLKPPVHSYISELAADPPAPAKCAETVAPAELTA